MKRILISLMLIGAALTSQAQLLDSRNPLNPLGLSVRMGVNTSSISNNFPSSINDIKWNSGSWGTGFTLGVVADLRFKNFFAITPGFFFQSRSMNYQNMMSLPSDRDPLLSYDNSQDGHIRSYNFNVPVLFSLRLNLMPVLQGQVDLGPYFMWGFGGSNKYVVEQVYGTQTITQERKVDVYGDNGLMRKYDWGVKAGFGFKFASRYYLGVHYMCGLRNCYTQPVGAAREVKGHNKAWDVTFGWSLF